MSVEEIQISGNDAKASCLVNVLSVSINAKHFHAVNDAWNCLKKSSGQLTSLIQGTTVTIKTDTRLNELLDLSKYLTMHQYESNIKAITHIAYNSYVEYKGFMKPCEDNASLLAIALKGDSCYIALCLNHGMFDYYSHVILMNQLLYILNGGYIYPVYQTNIDQLSDYQIPESQVDFPVYMESAKYQFEKQPIPAEQDFVYCYQKILELESFTKLYEKLKSSNISLVAFLTACDIHSKQFIALSQQYNFNIMIPISIASRDSRLGNLVDLLYVSLPVEYIKTHTFNDLLASLDTQIKARLSSYQAFLAPRYALLKSTYYPPYIPYNAAFVSSLGRKSQLGCPSLEITDSGFLSALAMKMPVPEESEVALTVHSYIFDGKLLVNWSASQNLSEKQRNYIINNFDEVMRKYVE